MNISSKGRYALRTMLDLAMYNTGEPVRLKDIAHRQDISEKYLEQIFSLLNKAGLVNSVRGANGGYYLSRPADKYTVGEILRVTEGSLSPVACVESDDCARKMYCATYILFKKLDDAISDVVDKTTLADLVDWDRTVATDYII